MLERVKPPSVDLRFDATQAILAELKKGLRADLLILTSEAMDGLAANGHVAQVRVLGSSGIGVAARSGAPRPDIRTLDAFKRALESAASVAHSKVGASGIYFSALLERLDIRLQKRIVVERGPVGAVVACGEAELGVQQLCELAPVPGIDIVGPLPEAVQKLTRFSAGIPATAADARGAASLLQLLSSDAARAALLAGGMEPAR